MIKEIKKSVILFGGITLLCGVGYPLLMNTIGQSAFTSEAKGSLVYEETTPIASTLIGQNFSKPYYFHSRPSAAGTNGYDGTSSGGSNFGYTSQKLHDAVKDRVALYREENALDATQKVPMDAVTGSASGLDPHITPKNATLQAKRVAEARGLEISKVVEAIEENTKGKYLGIIGEEKVNVVTLNLTLDRKFGKVKI